MAIAAYQFFLAPMRMAACTVLFNVLRMSRLLDRGWPALGVRFRRLVLVFWWNVARVIGGAIRDRLRGQPTTGHASQPADEGPAVTPESLALPRSETPVVSIIIPTFGQVAFTLRCLASIEANAPDAAIEVIVVDDAWPGPDAASLSRVVGIRLLRNEINLGFLRACNSAVRTARGEFVLFLNNDTLVRPGWLDRMIAVFATHADTGMVGSKLIGPDGDLREAGGIVWKDGSAWNYGLGGDKDAPEYNYLREADYCSGASLLVRRRVFLDVGGFDEKYAPAYCEDSDLAFRLRHIGLKTRYQPRSEVVHFEGVSHGRDVRVGVKACQVVNQARFLETWHPELSRDHFLNGTHVMRARDRAIDRQIVLIVDHYVPEPDRDAGSRTMVVFIRALLASGVVVKFWPANLYRSPGYTDALQDMGVEVLHGPHQAALPAWLRVNGADLDIVLLSRPDVAGMCLPMVRAGTAARVVYYGHDLHFRRLADEAARTGNPGQHRAAEVMRAQENLIWREVDTVLYPSEEEADIVRSLASGTDVRSVIPYAFSDGPEPVAADREPPGDAWILFVAGFGHPPNAEAACWFVRHVLPLIVARVPAARLAIVGSNPSAAVAALAGPGVCLFANVTDAALLDWYRLARVAVVPLLGGAGVKLKTVEALWHGVPAVMTPAGAQGLPGLSAVVPIEADPAAFAAAVCDLLIDDALWSQRSAAESTYARERFDEARQRRSLLRGMGIVVSVPASEACVTEPAMA